ncbi:MAG TPA: hypothetical protein VGK67_15645 [Myxococcales bacterium]|jgi:hypothetical protein
MKTYRLVALLAVAALGLAGCGGSKPFCDRQKESFDSVLGTMSDCPSAKSMMEANRPDDSKCEANYADCSAADKEILDATVTCLSGLPTCTKDTEATTWASKAIVCQSKANSLSTACAKISRPSFCKVQKATLDLTLQKVANCPTMKSGMEAGRPPDGKCDTVYPSCTEADQVVLDDMVRCLSALPVCTPETETGTWATGAIACQNKANLLSESCAPITQP